MYDTNDLILGYFGKFRDFGILGYFGHFKVNLGSRINFAFITLNFSYQNFKTALLTWTMFQRRF